MRGAKRSEDGGGSARIGTLAGLLLLGGCYSGLGAHDANLAAEGSAGGDAGSDGADADDDAGDGAAPLSCGGAPPSVAPRALRRLTPTQYRNTIRDLLGVPDLDPEFDDGDAVPSERGIRQLRGAAEGAIARLGEWSPGLVPCDIQGTADEACPSAVIDALAPRAFRRPLTEDERAWLLAVYEEAREEQDFRSGMEAMIGTILQAPAFLYHLETGTPVDGVENLVALDDHALASRLSYFLWDSMPDQALLDAAAAGELSTEEGLRAQAMRMASDARTEAKMQAFVHHWLGLDGGPAHFALGEQTKDPDYFPEYTPALVEAMQVELEAFVRRTLFEGDGSFDALLTSRDAYVNGSIGALYDASGAPMDDQTWAWVQLDPTQRSGLLTRAAFLSTYASPLVQSPIRRGVFVLEEVLCAPLGEPPPNASDVPVDGGEVDGEVRSVREDVEVRTQGPDCQGCHALINNIGFSFEHYDAIGRWRTEELTSGRTIDASGKVMGTDVDGEVADAVELSQRLTESDKVKRCFAERWFEQAVGGAPAPEDDCSVTEIQDSFAAGGNVREMLVAIALSDAFRYMSTKPEGE